MAMQRFDGGIATKRLEAIGPLALGTPVTGITAHAGGGQASATLLTANINDVGTVATAADSVKLPPPTIPGQIIVVANNGANAMQVFGSGTDTINGVATATGVSQPAGKHAFYVSEGVGAGTNWLRNLSA